MSSGRNRPFSDDALIEIRQVAKHLMRGHLAPPLRRFRSQGTDPRDQRLFTPNVCQRSLHASCLRNLHALMDTITSAIAASAKSCGYRT